MATSFYFFLCLLFCVHTGSGIRMQRDFSYPVVKGFPVYWNVATFLCQRHGVDFEPHTRKFGIITNDRDSFRGNAISILYDPGLFPAMLKDSNGKLVERNGGIPQQGNLTAHLEAFKEYLEKAVPQGFDGVGVIDFEAYRPIFRQNWNEETIYKTMSKDLERQHHPQWPEDKINSRAAQNFEDASKVFFESTLQLAKLLRPRALWGYYGFPYCLNYRNENKPTCPEMVEKENNRIQWLFDESTALYPSVYMSTKLNEEEQKKFLIGRMNEAWRMSARVSNRKIPPVYPYIGYKYISSDKFLSPADMYSSLRIPRDYKMGGAIIWGATDTVNTKEKCLSLLDYLNNVLGPAVAQVRGLKDEAPQVPQTGN